MSPETVHFTSINDLALDLSWMSGRELVIYGTSLLDTALAHRIRHQFVEDMTERETNRFFGGAASSLSAKVQICRAFGLISPQVAEQVTHVARLRNKFAHRILVDSSDHPDALEVIASFDLTDPSDVIYPPPAPKPDDIGGIPGEFTRRGHTYKWADQFVIVSENDYIVFFVPAPRPGQALSSDDRVRHQIWSCLVGIVVPGLDKWIEQEPTAAVEDDPNP